MPKGRVSEVLGPDAIGKILAAIKTINDLLPFLIVLPPEDRKRMLKLGPKSAAFVESLYGVAASNPGLIPPAYDFPEFERDVNLLKAFKSFAPKLHQLAEAVDDTQMVAGGEAMTTALLLYGTLKDARKVVPGLDGAVAEVGARFKRGKRAKTQ